MRVHAVVCVPVVCGIAVLTAGTFSLGAQDESASRDPGIYMATAGQTPPQYAMVHVHSVSDTHQTGAAKTTMTMGLTGMNMSVDVGGAKAPLRAASGDVVFLIQLNTPPKPGKGGNQPPPDISTVMAQAGRDREMPMGLKSPDSFSLLRASIDGETRHFDLGSQGGKKILGGSRKPKDAVDVSVDKLGPDLFRVKPKSPLGPGEYAFAITQAAAQVWDFGVDER
jgi:hypothetical protein